MIKFAITGNIASGKSQVEKILKDLDYKVFDTDELAHEILYSSSRIKEEFSEYDIFEDDIISRKKLGNLVFNNKELKIKLEKIMHPLIRRKIQAIFEEYQSEKYVFISITLLFEADMQCLFDKIMMIYCEDDMRLKRLMNRNNFTKEEALIRIKSQKSQELKIPKCDYVIKNDSSLECLKENILKVLTH